MNALDQIRQAQETIYRDVGLPEGLWGNPIINKSQYFWRVDQGLRTVLHHQSRQLVKGSHIACINTWTVSAMFKGSTYTLFKICSRYRRGKFIYMCFLTDKGFK